MKTGMTTSFINVIKDEGFLALYKGLVPPLVGSSIFRAVQFAVYNACHTSLKEVPFFRYVGIFNFRDISHSERFQMTLHESDFSWFLTLFHRKEIPFTGQLESRVIFAGVIASTARAVVETPLELIKVNQQIGVPWSYRSLFRGFGVTWIRTVGLMTTFFALCDTADRHFPTLTATAFVGPFLKGGIAATIGWWVIWPFENLKSQIQARNPGPTKVWPRFFWVLKNGGVSSLFRGFVPGSWRSIIANGASMLAYQWCQDARKYYTSKK